MNKIKIIIAGLFLASAISSAIAVENVGDNSTYIIGHWNYPPNSVNPIYVVSEGDDVELFVNDVSNGHGRPESKYLFAFDNVNFQPGTLTAVSYDAEGKELGRYTLLTSGVPAQLHLSVLEYSDENKIEEPEDIIIQCRLTDFYGKRCLADNRTVLIEIEEPADLSEIPVKLNENVMLRKQLKLNKGENNLSIKKPSKSGVLKVTAKAPGLAPNYIWVKSN